MNATPSFISRPSIRVIVVVHHNHSQIWPSNWIVMHMPNMGHEAGCILRWITNAYQGSGPYQLADFTAFIHDRKDHYARTRLLRRIRSVFTARTGMLALAIIDGVLCDVGVHGGHNSKGQAIFHHLRHMREVRHGITCHVATLDSSSPSLTCHVAPLSSMGWPWASSAQRSGLHLSMGSLLSVESGSMASHSVCMSI